MLGLGQGQSVPRDPLRLGCGGLPGLAGPELGFKGQLRVGHGRREEESHTGLSPAIAPSTLLGSGGCLSPKKRGKRSREPSTRHTRAGHK